MMAWFTAFIISVYFLFVGKKMLEIVFENGEPVRTVAWIMAILFFPIVGLLLYHLVGKNIKKEKRFKEKYLDDCILYENKLAEDINSKEELSSENLQFSASHKLVRLLEKNGISPLTFGNQVEILSDGKDTFQSIFEAIKDSKKYIHLEYYILKQGKVADELFLILARKVKEGVAVRIIYDGVGSWELDRKYIERLKHEGIEIFPFMPVRFGPLANRINYRNHRKIIVVDGKIGFTGGINLADKYVFGDEELGHWHDIHFKIEGPAVEQFDKIFLQDWFFVSGKKVHYPVVKSPNNSNGHPMQVVASGPDSRFAIIQQEYFTIFNEAKEYIYITTPYFIPGRPIIEALKVAALSGVEVILLLPDKSDSKILKWSVRSYLEDLLEAGVRIFLYQKGFVHSKTIVSDDNFASIGTANVDQRSFNQNFEVNAVVYGEVICKQLKTHFFKDLRDSKELFHDQFYQRPIPDRLLESTARLLSPLL